MSAQTVDLVIEQGTDWSRGWGVTVSGVPIDSSWQARSQVRSKLGDLLHEFTADITAEGAVVIAVSPAESSEWTWFDGLYDVKVTSADGGTTLRVAKGTVTVDRSVTE